MQAVRTWTQDRSRQLRRIAYRERSFTTTAKRIGLETKHPHHKFHDSREETPFDFIVPVSSPTSFLR